MPSPSRRLRRNAGAILAAAVLVSAVALVVTTPGASPLVPVRGVATTPTPQPTSTVPSPSLPCPTQLPACTTSTTTTSRPRTSTPTTSTTTTPRTSSTTPTTSQTTTATSTSTGATFTNQPPVQPVPTLPPASPGAPPQPPELEVQQILLVPATIDPVPPASTVGVHVTLEARRGTDVYSVPHAQVHLAIVSSAGEGASVDPADGASGDTGSLDVVVHTGSQPGDTVVEATSGSASGQVVVHGAPPPTAAATSDTTSAALIPPPSDSGGSTGRRVLLIALLAAVLVGLLSALAASGRVPFLRRRRRGVWGRRSI